MNSSQTRLQVLAGCLGAGFCIVILHLWFLMVQQHEVWAERSQENRWSFRAVPSQRGALRDRHGRAIAYDEPTTQLSVHYLRFRLRHPIGAAVHGATVWAGLQPGGEGTRYGYGEGALGPHAAVRHLLSMPASLLRPRALPKGVAGELAFAVTTVLANCTGLPRKVVFSALRKAADQGGGREVGDVLAVPRAEVLDAFTRRVDALRALDGELQRVRGERALAAGLPVDEFEGLVALLDDLRRASLDKEVVRWTDPKTGTVREGSLVENVRRVFDDRVPFELAARLRIDAEQNPGLEVSPSVQRVHTQPPDSALRVLVGALSDLDRARPDDEWFERHQQRELPAEWLADLVPTGVVETDEERVRLQSEARSQYEQAMLREERRGTSGMEAGFDEDLMGRLGLRLVERDSKRREQMLLSHLRVESGDDVTLTIDLDLQHAAEVAVRVEQARTAALHVDEADRRRVEAALAVVDARTGDVLAYAGAPIVSPRPADVPGVVWTGNGSIGSVVKPFVLVEQLQSEALARPHRPIADLEACSGSYVYGGTRIRCSHAHWDGGRDPVEAIAESCNSFFYQCAVGLGEEGLARAFRRFGLMAPAGEADPFAVCWQPTLRGLATARPRVGSRTLLPRRGVGYAVEASPLAVARAYAALATGSLPTLGLQLGERRPQVQLGDLAAELEVVREGMRRCVQTGTARRIERLQALQVLGKTGTAEIGTHAENNAWFAGFLPWAGRDGIQLCVCAVVYWVPDGVHGGDAAGQLVGDFLDAVLADARLEARYLQPERGR